MGLGVYIEAPLGPLRLRLRDLEAVAAAARQAIDEPLLAELARIIAESENEIGLWLHPSAEPISFRLDPGALTASCKSSTTGPGYHAYVVEMLERMADQQGLAWNWDDESGETGDECGYHESRDFESVQVQMGRWLQQLADHISGEDMASVMISLPIEFAPVRPGKICSPAGVWEPDWVGSLVNADQDQLMAAGREFFPWWSQGCDGELWRRYGESLCWTEIPWHPPATDAEAAAYDSALSAFARSRELSPGIVLPDLEIAELRRLRDSPVEDASPPRPTGLGFRRGPMTWSISGGWTVELPGYWYADVEDGAMVLWFTDRTIRASSFSVDGPKDSDLLASVTEKNHYDSEDQLVTWDRDHLRAQAVVHWTDDGDGYWILDGCVVTGGSLCIVTCCFDEEQDRAWAEEVFRTVRAPPPE